MSDESLHAEVLASVRQVRDELTLVRAELKENHATTNAALSKHMIDESEDITTMKVAIESSNRLMMEMQRGNTENSRISAETTAQLVKIAETLSSLDDKTTSIEGAFPNKDPKGHHDHHMLLITNEQRWKTRVEKWKDDIGGWGVKITLIFVALAVWEAFKVNLK